MTKTAPCGYNDADVVRARKYITIDERGCHLWTGSGSGMKPRNRSISSPYGDGRYTATVLPTPQYSLHSKKVKPQQLFYAAANGLAIDDVPQLSCICPGDNKRLCCNAAHLRPRLVNGQPIRRNTPQPIPAAPITPELVAKLGLTLTQAEINARLNGPPTLRTYEETAAWLAEQQCQEYDTIEFFNEMTGGKLVILPIYFDRYMKETYPQ